MAVPPLVEVDTISPASFDKPIPFFVTEQSERSCLCVHCYRAKLGSVALRTHWSTLHHGDTPGSPCTCTCDLCVEDGGCGSFLPYAAANEVFSMGKLSDKLLCKKEFLYDSVEEGAVSRRTSRYAYRDNAPSVGVSKISFLAVRSITATSTGAYPTLVRSRVASGRANCVGICSLLQMTETPAPM